MRDTFVKLRSGLFTPKHVNAIGGAIWLFGYLLDHTDWNTGTMYGYTDADASAALGLSINTIRKYRRILEPGYISVQKRQHSQDVTIVKWENPKTGEKLINGKPVQSDTPVPVSNQSGTQSGTQSGMQPIGNRTTPTLDSDNRDQIPEGDGSNYEKLQDAFMNATGVLSPSYAESWAKSFATLLKAKVEPEDIIAAVVWLDEHDRHPVRPSQIITSALTAKRKRTSPAKPAEKPRMKKQKGPNFETDPTDYRMVPA
jgi:hypothetical protein